MDKDRPLIDCVGYILLDSPRFIDLYAKRSSPTRFVQTWSPKKLNSRSIIERSISPKRAISRGRKNLLLDFEFKLVRPFVQDNQPILLSPIPGTCRQSVRPKPQLKFGLTASNRLPVQLRRSRFRFTPTSTCRVIFASDGVRSVAAAIR